MIRAHYARNAGQIIDDALRLCRDFRIAGGGGRIWRWQEVLDELNSVMADLAKSTGVLRSVNVIHLIEDTNIYDLPPDCIRPLRFQLNGIDGTVLLPITRSQMDIRKEAMTRTGNPESFFREFLAPHQVGFFPKPDTTGSTFTRQTEYGLLRKIADASGSIPYDQTGPLRTIRGVPFSRGVRGGVVRGVIDPQGNIEITYVRVAQSLSRHDEYPDQGFPQWLHPYLKFGVAARMLFGARTKVNQEKLIRFNTVWSSSVNRVKRLTEWRGPINEVRPL